MLIVPNNKLYDYDADFKELYPHAKLLTLAQNDFQKANLTATLARAATNDWDAIIIRHSSLERIPVGNDMQVDFLRRQIREAEEVYADLADDSMQTKRLMAALEKLRAKLAEAMNTERAYNSLTFEEIGFDMVVIDEAHYYKNLYLPGKAGQTKECNHSRPIKHLIY